MHHEFAGTLVLPEVTGKFEYQIFDNRDIRNIRLVNLSEVLDEIYFKSSTSEVIIEVTVWNYESNAYLGAFCEKGQLYLDKVADMDITMYIGEMGSGVCLDDVLFDNVGKKVVIDVIDLDFARRADKEDLEVHKASKYIN